MQGPRNNPTQQVETNQSAQERVAENYMQKWRQKVATTDRLIEQFEKTLDEVKKGETLKAGKEDIWSLRRKMKHISVGVGAENMAAEQNAARSALESGLLSQEQKKEIEDREKKIKPYDDISGGDKALEYKKALLVHFEKAAKDLDWKYIENGWANGSDAKYGTYMRDVVIPILECIADYRDNIEFRLYLDSSGPEFNALSPEGKKSHKEKLEKARADEKEIRSTIEKVRKYQDHWYAQRMSS